MNHSQNLLNKTWAIVQKHESIADLSGENFNIFQIMSMTTNEVYTHSAILAELLNTKGSHGLGSAPLELFVNMFPDKIVNFKTENATAKKEHYIGGKTDTEGGRIDILITNEINQKIIIENKIYARDQERQMLRYYNFDQTAPLFYLTLDGNKAEPYTTGEKPLDINHISYKVHIIEWLELCRKEAANRPLVRETIAQYINLIKQLTNQTTNNLMGKEIVKQVLQDKESLQAFFELYNQYDNVKIGILDKLKEQLKSIAEDKELDIEFDSNKDFNLNSYNEDGDFSFNSSKLNAKEVKILFSFETAGWRDFTYGFEFTTNDLSFEKKEKIANEIIIKLKEKGHLGVSSLIKDDFNFPAYIYWNPCEEESWGPKTFEAILNGKFSIDVKNKIKELLDII